MALAVVVGLIVPEFGGADGGRSGWQWWWIWL